MVKVEKLDWRMDIHGANNVAVELRCADFEQSLRFIEAFKGFILSERDKEQDAEASHAPKEATSQNENSRQGEVQGQSQQPGGTNGIGT